MNGFYDQVIAVLKKHGYSFLRPGKGAHEIWSNGQRSQAVSRNMQSRHTANEVMKQAGIPHRFN